MLDPAPDGVSAGIRHPRAMRIGGAAGPALGGNRTDYTAWLMSYPSGGECYGVLIRDLNAVRPIVVNGGPTGDDGQGPNDPYNAALTNLDRNDFMTWPATFDPRLGEHRRHGQLRPLRDALAAC